MKSTPPVTSLRWKLRSLSLLLLAGLSFSCGLLTLGGGTAEGKPAGAASGDLVTEAIKGAPALVDSLTNFLWTAVLGTLLLALMFRRSRAAMAAAVTALFNAMTYRINQWKIKKATPEDPDGA